MKNSYCRGRLAPSPTGLLHLGNAWAFLLAWLACRACSGSMILRLEDVDPQRSKPDYIRHICEDLTWLGLDWDEGPYLQSERREIYMGAIERLRQRGRIYPCFCTRKELKALAGAPHLEDVGPVYPGTCRQLSDTERAKRIDAGKNYALRLICDDANLTFFDRIRGKMTVGASEWGGDFALMRSDGVIAYQLAVALDDSLMGVTQVVRGRDILWSTPKQLFLLELLGLPKPEDYAHIPLLLDAEGERLAKRHQSLSLQNLRSRGVSAERIVGFLAYLAGMNPGAEKLRAKDLVKDFALNLLPRKDITLTATMCSALLG